MKPEKKMGPEQQKDSRIYREPSQEGSLFGMRRGVALWMLRIWFDLDGNPPLQTGPNGAGTKEIAQEGEAFIHHEDEAEDPKKGKKRGS